MKKSLLVLSTIGSVFAISPVAVIASCTSQPTIYKEAQELVKTINDQTKKLQMVKGLSYNLSQIQSWTTTNDGIDFIKEIKDLNQILEQPYLNATLANDAKTPVEISTGWVKFKLKISSKSNSNDVAYTKWLKVQFAQGQEPSLPDDSLPPTNPGPTPTPPSVPVPPVNPIPPAPEAPVEADVLAAKQEAARINQLANEFKLSLHKANGAFRQNQPWTWTELAAINGSQVLEHHLSGLNQQSGFSYQVVNWREDALQTQSVGFNIIVAKNNARVYTERIIIKVDLDPDSIDPQKLVEQEAQRINSLTLKPIILANQQQMEDMFFDTRGPRILKRSGAQLGLKPHLFTYEAQNVVLDKNNFTTSFQVLVQLRDKQASTQQKSIKWTYANRDDFYTPEWHAEKARLQSLSLTLKNPNLTSLEFNELNSNNLFEKLNGFTADSNFAYKIDNLMKDEAKGEIGFQIWINHQALSHLEFRYDEKQQSFVNFKVKFNLLKSTSADQWSAKDDQYIKDGNHKVSPINDGSNYFAKAGTGNNDIDVSQGQGPTEPSSGVELNAQLQTGKIKTQTEINQLKNTFSIGFESAGGGMAFGTAWIIDYQLKDNNQDPDTFYLATNAHVAQNLKIAADVMTPERYDSEYEPFHNTKFVELATIKDPQIGKTYGNTTNNDQYLKARLNANQVRTIFIGNDYLTTSPGDFNKTNANWFNNQEYLDFAVLEIKFNNSDQAKTMTQDYAHSPERQFKYKQESLLAQANPIIQNNYSVLGFPAIRQDSYWRPTILTTSRSINNDTDDLASLASSKFYNTFNGKTGMFDAAIGLSFFGYNYREAYQVNNWYVSSGLIYPLDYGSLGEGSSGSMMMDRDGYTVGIHFAGDFKASTGFTTSLYSEGFDYQGAFGKYNLQSYDAIDGNRAGNHPNQKHSYRTNMLKLYGKDFKTNLYPQGLTNNLKKM